MAQDIIENNGTPVTRRKKEHFLGTILLVVIIFFILSSLAGIGWVGYSQWRNAQIEKNKPTIQTLSEPEAEPVVENERQEATPADAPATEATPQSEEAKDISKEKVAILNGGAATGAAAKLADALKKDGVTEVTTGSTQGDFTGTVVYHKKEKEGEAKVLLEKVQKEYKDATLKEQDTTKKETTTEDLTVILGASS
jgi:hypothetical protein